MKVPQSREAEYICRTCHNDVIAEKDKEILYWQNKYINSTATTQNSRNPKFQSLEKVIVTTNNQTKYSFRLEPEEERKLDDIFFPDEQPKTTGILKLHPNDEAVLSAVLFPEPTLRLSKCLILT